MKIAVQRPRQRPTLARMRHFIPHLVLFGLVLAVVVFGFVVNSGVIGSYIGATAATFADPAQTLAAVLIGALVRKQRYLIPALLLLGIGTAVYIAQKNAHMGVRLTEVLMTVKILASFLVGYAANAASIAVRLRAAKSTSVGA